jgi:potassium-transporting ATPase KdpC subunit
MLSLIRPSLALLVLFTALTGVAYPLAMTGFAQAVMPYQANGSQVVLNGKVVGSALIGQDFESDKYFHPRPSATSGTDPNDATKTISLPYNAAASTGSNLGPTSKALGDAVKARVAALGGGPVPADLVTTSASGLDPDISPEGAQFQVKRVAAARGLPEQRVAQLVEKSIDGRTLGVLGEPVVNVLALNMALDQLKP